MDLNSEYKDYQWKITTSPRSPDLDVQKYSGNAEFLVGKIQHKIGYQMKWSKVKLLLTPESVSVL